MHSTSLEKTIDEIFRLGRLRAASGQTNHAVAAIEPFLCRAVQGPQRGIPAGGLIPPSQPGAY